MAGEVDYKEDMPSCLDIALCENIFVIGVYQMVLHRPKTQILVIATALLLLGTNADAFGLLPGFCSNCRASTADCPVYCTVCRRDTYLSNYLEPENTCFTACPEEKGQYPEVPLISRFEYSEQVGLPKTRCLGPASTPPSDRSYRPERIHLHHSLTDTLVLMNCVFLI